MNNLFLIIVALLLVALNGFLWRLNLVSLNCGRRAFARLPRHGVGVDAFWLQCIQNSMPIYQPASWALRSLRWAWAGSANLHLPVCWTCIRQAWGHSTGTDTRHLVACAFSIISFLHIVVGELAPKSMAIRNPEQVGYGAPLPSMVFIG